MKEMRGIRMSSAGLLFCRKIGGVFALDRCDIVSVPQSSVVSSLRWDTTARGEGEKSNYKERTGGGHGTERKQGS